MAKDLAGLKARLSDWLLLHQQSYEDFGMRAGLSAGTVRRLVVIPTYRSSADAWRRVAAACDWDPVETLYAAGFIDAPPAAATGGWPVITRELLALGLTDGEVATIRGVVDSLLAARRPNTV